MRTDNQYTGPIPARRHRTTIWRMSTNTAYVRRGSRLGNPIEVCSTDPHSDGMINASNARERFCEPLATDRMAPPESGNRRELYGEDLACWYVPAALTEFAHG